MDIPYIMKGFSTNEGGLLINTIVKAPSIKAKELKEKDKLHFIFMDLDLDNGAITFEARPYNPDENRTAKKYNYFGNNQGVARQTYAVRDAGSFVRYWIAGSRGVIHNIAEMLDEGALKNLLNECRQAGFFDDKGLNLDKFLWAGGKEEDADIQVSTKEKTLYMNGEKLTSEKFVHMCVDSGTSKIILVVPRIIKDGERIVISTHPDYCRAIEKSLAGESEGTSGICHICGVMKEDINTMEYSTNFFKGGIGKVFVTTPVNYAPDFEREMHQRNYGICRGCYESLMSGEQNVMKEWRLRIAGEDCVLLVEGLDQDINYTHKGLEKLKSEIDVFFNPKDTMEWFQNLKRFLSREKHEVYQFNMVFYKTDGRSCAIKKSIESINSFRFANINSIFERVREPFGESLPYFTIGHLYRMIPVMTNKKRDQVNIKRVLDLYGAILTGTLIDHKLIFDLFAEAIDEGLTNIMASEIHNNKNLYYLDLLHKKEWGRDSYIRQMSLFYLALFQVLQKLEILDKEVLFVDDTKTTETLKNKKKAAAEMYLESRGFPDSSKGLFYMGMLMYQVGQAQYRQNHRDKPILNRLTYTGMDYNDILRFWGELREKVTQYSRILLNDVINKDTGYTRWDHCEYLTGKAAYYFGSYPTSDHFNDKENLFYILSGYGFCVSSYSGTSSKQEDGVGKENGGTEND